MCWLFVKSTSGMDFSLLCLIRKPEILHLFLDIPSFFPLRAIHSIYNLSEPLPRVEILFTRPPQPLNFAFFCPKV